jgi:spermidine synthase
MAVEIIASRILAPYFGASLFVWTSLILTILVALAVGYWLGGVVAEKGANDLFISILLCVTGAMLVAGVWVSNGFSAVLTTMLAAWPNASIGLFLGSLAAAAVIFALPVLIMGMMGPILLKRLSTGSDVGKASGRYLVASTMGSVVGTLLPTLLLVPNLGSRHSLELVATLFIVLGAVTLPRRRRGAMVLALALPVIGLTYSQSNQPQDNALFQKESGYQMIRVTERDGWHYLLFNEGSGIQSVYVPEGGRTYLYYDLLSVVPLLRPFHDGDHQVAILGLAGGTGIPRYTSLLPPGSTVDFTGVEVDDQVIDVARRYFGINDMPVRVLNQDGRNFLRSTTDTFDAILVDAYSNQLYIPSHMVTKEFFDLVRTRLKPGGILVTNINVTSSAAPLFRSLAATVSQSFPFVVAIPELDAYNQLIMASDQPIDTDAVIPLIPAVDGDLADYVRAATPVEPDPSVRVFTDDWAPVEFMTESMIIAETFKQHKDPLQRGRGL